MRGGNGGPFEMVRSQVTEEFLCQIQVITVDSTERFADEVQEMKYMVFGI